MYPDASHLWRSFSHNRTKINIQFLNESERGTNKSSEKPFAVRAICLSLNPIHSPMNPEKKTHSLKDYKYTSKYINIVAAFRGMHVSPAKHSYAWLPRKCDYRTDTRRTDRHMPEKVIPMCRYASQVTQKSRLSEECMCCLRNIAMRDYQESVTTRQTHRQMDRQTPDKVILLCRYASQAAQKWRLLSKQPFAKLYTFERGIGVYYIHWMMLYTGKISPRFFFFALFTLWHEGEFKTGLIQSFLKDYVRKLVSGRIQNWANQFRISIGGIGLGEFKAVYSRLWKLELIIRYFANNWRLP